MPRLNDPAKAKPSAIARWLRQQIRRGHYQPGEELPSLLQLAHDLDVSEWTTRRAVRLLAQEGLLERVAGRRFHVRRRRPQPVMGVLFGGFGDATDAARISEPSPYYRIILAAAQAELKRRGCRPRVYAVNNRNMAEYADNAQLVRDVKRGLLAGVFTFGWSPVPQPGADPSTAAGLAQLMIDRGVPYTGISSSRRVPAAVGLDMSGNVRRLTRHLLDAGARDVYLMLFTDERMSSIDGFRQALAERGLADHRDRLLFAPWPNDREGYAAFTRWWTRPPDVDRVPLGLAVLDDQLARGALMGVLDRQVRIPEQLRLGVLSIKGGETFSPRPLTRLEVDPAAMVAEAVDRLLGMVREPTAVPAPKHVSCRVVEAEG